MSREYEALFNEMSKTPALPAGITPMPSLAATMPQTINYAEETRKAYPGAYCAKEIDGNAVFLIIVPARNEAEAEVGSGILAIGRSETEAWFKASMP